MLSTPSGGGVIGMHARGSGGRARGTLFSFCASAVSFSRTKGDEKGVPWDLFLGSGTLVNNASGLGGGARETFCFVHTTVKVSRIEGWEWGLSAARYHRRRRFRYVCQGIVTARDIVFLFAPPPFNIHGLGGGGAVTGTFSGGILSMHTSWSESRARGACCLVPSIT